MDCEDGVVSSSNAHTVFVRYYNKEGKLKETAQGTNPDDLVVL